MGAKEIQVNFRIREDLRDAFKAKLAVRGEQPGAVLTAMIESYTAGAPEPSWGAAGPPAAPVRAAPYVAAISAAVAEAVAPLAERLGAVERALAGPGPLPVRVHGGGDGKPARTRAERAAPKSGTRARAVGAAAKAVASGDRSGARRRLSAVPPGTVAFKSADDAEAVPGYPVPAAADHSAKRGLR